MGGPEVDGAGSMGSGPWVSPWLAQLPSLSKHFAVRPLFARRVDPRRRVDKGGSQLLQSIYTSANYV